MLSNDQNVETIAQLASQLKRYWGLQTEYLKLDIVEKIVRLLTVLTMTVVLGILLMLMLIYLSFAVAHALEPHTGLAWGHTIVAGVYFFLLMLFIIFRKKWIERPLVKFLAGLLIDQ